MKQAKLTRISAEEYRAAEVKALENNTVGLSYVNTIQDYETLNEISAMLSNASISAASFETYTGDYEPLFVRFDYPPIGEDKWHKVTWE